MRPSPGEDIGALVQLACLLEVSAPKPGNVSRDVGFHDTTYADFLASAAAIGQPLGSAGDRPLGATILRAVEATRRWTSANTNLGIVLLLAPLARAAAFALTVPEAAGVRLRAERTTLPPVPPAALRDQVRHVLHDTTVADARDAYAAIRLAAPGGLGTVSREDVNAEPTVALTAAMMLAADRDGIAREYASDFQTTFEIAEPVLRAALDAGLSWDAAIIETYVTLLAHHPDTHIARRAGAAAAAAVSAEAREVLARGGPRTAAGRAALASMDDHLREPLNRTNPGTTADLTAAATFVALLGGAWHHGNGAPHADR